MFDSVDPKQRLSEMEKAILQYWREENVFKRSVDSRTTRESSDGKPEQTYSFYDGPPFATGLPHYGHLLAGTIKDVIPRYQTMKGHHVQRRFGWDCHGLPIENLIEKENGIEGPAAIEGHGVDKFCDLCRDAVQRYTTEWKEVVERMGRWVDMDWDYKTMDPDYMESMWWAFKQLHEKKLIYEGHKSMHICTRCVTPLSNFEVTQGYSDRTDMSVYMTFPLRDDPNTVLVAWTTTPWSLPGNMWLLISDKIEYVKLKVADDDRTYIMAAKLVEEVCKGKEYEVVGDVDAKELIGQRYEPLFPYIKDKVMPSTEETDSPVTYGEKGYFIVLDDHDEVSDAEGTGIVHIATAYGEDGFRMCQEHGIDVVHHVNMDGSFTEECTDLQGMLVKPEGDDPMSTDKVIVQLLKDWDRCFGSTTYKHSYPHCWRCDSPLLNYSTSSWFVDIQSIKEKMLSNKEKTSWVPNHLRDGRYGNWLENARDWAISRNRYWGTPLPIWRSPQGDLDFVGSRDELMQHNLLRFTKVSVVRHAESEGNTIPIYQSELPGTDLTERGRAQAKNAADFLAAGNTPDVIYCSPLARCQQTAQAIADATGAEVIVDERLSEVAFGEYEGKTIDFNDLLIQKAKRTKKLEENSPESIYHFSGMETWDEVGARLDAFFEEKLPFHRSEHVVVVTHADLLKHAECFFTQDDPVKVSHQPYPELAELKTYFWDHAREKQMDLHKDRVDDIVWNGSPCEQSVDVTLVRHGQTDWNAETRLQGHTDNPLNDTGRAQAKEAGEALKGQEFDVILSSDLKRAKETADIIAAEIGGTVEVEPLLRERDLGALEGRTRDEVQAEYPHLDFSVGFSFHHFNDGGESLTDFLNRTQQIVDVLVEKYAGKKVLLVSHGGPSRSLNALANNLGYKEAYIARPENTGMMTFSFHPQCKRIPDVLDCWFESGSMPYAQENFPFRMGSGDGIPSSFPADFIAEGIDQCRTWFYVLMVLSTALFGETPFKNVVVNGIVLAEDGKKMSKRLQNYPDPMELVEKYGADSIRFTLMRSPAVRGEDLRMSEQLVEQSMRTVLLPLWNTYSFFVTYANAAGFEPVQTRRHSSNPLDQWILTEVQDLVNRMTDQFESYNLAATCAELDETIDMLTNWYVRLSRRRFAGKSGVENSAAEQAHIDVTSEDQQDALHTLHDVLLTISQLLCPFCPFITDAIYLNLVGEEHGSIHLTDWPETRELKAEEKALMQKTRLQRQIVSLGLSIRGEQKIKIRQPLAAATVAVPPALMEGVSLNEDDLQLMQKELNVKHFEFTDDPGSLATAVAMVNARAVGPRLGKRVQEIINAGKEGAFTVNDDGTVLILDETLSPDEVQIVYQGEGQGTCTEQSRSAAADKGIVVSLDTTISDELKLEGDARDLIRGIQRLRKEAGLEFTDQITLSVSGAEAVMEQFGDLVLHETKAVLGDVAENAEEIEVGEENVQVAFAKR